MRKAVLKWVADLVRNPIAILLVAVMISFGLFYASNLLIPDQTSPLAKSAGGIATAILTAGTFGFIFEYFNKQKLINESISNAIGQYRAVELGIVDVRLKVSEIDYRKDIIDSSVLIVGSRYSSSFFDRNREEIRERLSSKGLPLRIVYMNDPDVFPRTRNLKRTPEEFFGEMRAFDNKITDKVSLFKTDTKLCYNFVATDSGVWIKLYLNNKQQDLPPAFFVSKNSKMHALFMKDIEMLFSGGEAVVW